MAGRPTLYSAELAKEICERIAQGSNLDKIGRDDDMPSRSTVYKWLQEIDAFSDDYARARELRADSRADQIDDIIEKVGTEQLRPDQARVMIDAIKWQAGKEKPQRYGDKSTTELVGSGGGPVFLWGTGPE